MFGGTLNLAQVQLLDWAVCDLLKLDNIGLHLASNNYKPTETSASIGMLIAPEPAAVRVADVAVVNGAAGK